MISSLEVSTELIKRIIDHYSRIFHSYQAFVLRHMTSGEIKDTNQLFRSEFCLLIEMEDVQGFQMRLSPKEPVFLLNCCKNQPHIFSTIR